MELKAVDEMNPVWEAQILSHLKLTNGNYSATKAQRHKGVLEHQSKNNDFESLTLLFLLRVFCVLCF